jgi:hypothetical protein
MKTSKKKQGADEKSTYYGKGPKGPMKILSPRARESAPLPGATRARRHRDRLRRGRASYRCEADRKVLDMLVARRYLTEAEADDPAEVADAITTFLIDHS